MNRKTYSTRGCLFFILTVFCISGIAFGDSGKISEETSACIECHGSMHPGIVEDWKGSRMSRITPGEALKAPELAKRISVKEVPERLSDVVVGCAECHTVNPGKHRDTFEHEGHRVHIVVTPQDCATCHPVEAKQYSKNLMSHAYGNLNENPVYQDLMETVNGVQTFGNMKTVYKKSDPETRADSCNFCHGTKVDVVGVKTLDTDFGEMKLPVLTGWPNQGVGRVNPDNSKGSCTACHTRHKFSMQMARKPYTCSECHKGPDVPAYKVYSVSKHGTIFSSLGKGWDFDAVPWKAGKDFSAPTCAACHISLVSNEDGETVSERTHRMNDRMVWRIFGLVYAHPHPRSPDTTIVKNKAGLPLPTELTGEPATEYLISPLEQGKRRKAMEKICLSCHSSGWVEGHFERFENTIGTTDDMTLAATNVLLSAWDKGAAKGLAQKDSIFNEAIEKKWVEQWLFFANSTRYASAMSGSDYGVFANGRWYMSKNIQEMIDWLEFKTSK
jgi:hypothetical protein